MTKKKGASGAVFVLMAALVLAGCRGGGNPKALAKQYWEMTRNVLADETAYNWEKADELLKKIENLSEKDRDIFEEEFSRLGFEGLFQGATDAGIGEAGGSSEGSTAKATANSSSKNASSSGTDLDKLLNDFEETAKDYIELIWKAVGGDTTALTKAEQLQEKIELLYLRLNAASNRLSPAQVAKFEEILEKLEEVE
jgi:hypothetical protein